VTNRVKVESAVHSRLLTVAEAADIAAMKVNTMYALCQRHALPSVKLGKMVRIKETDLITWISDNTVYAKVKEGV
jgi:excisionase family DNA binding protein